jgi:hypothetical protein
VKRIREILDADAVNARAAIEILSAFDADLIGVFETTGELFERYNDCAGEAFSAQDDRINDQLSDIARDLGVSPDELITRIKAGDPAQERARALWQSLGVHPRRFVLMLLHRYFRWALASLLYFRLTPVLGYQRLQAEALGLLRLFFDEPSRAEQWLRTGLSNAGGRKFFNDSKKTVNETVKRYRLSGEYERGSAAYQHVRVNSAMRGLSITETGTQLRDQEIDPDDLGSYYRISLGLLSTQAKVFAGLADAVPDVQCEGWRDRLVEFARRLDRLWRMLEERYPLPPLERE